MFATTPLAIGACSCRLIGLIAGETAVSVSSGGLMSALTASGSPLVMTALLVGTLGLLAAVLMLRFLRWQFLLRCAAIRLPIRPVFSSYLSALPGLLTPGFVLEVARPLFLRRHTPVTVARVASVFVVERAYDLLALAALMTIGGPSGRMTIVGRLLLAGFAMFGVASYWLGRTGAERAETPLWSRRSVGWAFTASLLTWLGFSLALYLAAIATGATTTFGDAINAVVGTALGGIGGWWPDPVTTMVGGAARQLFTPIQPYWYGVVVALALIGWLLEFRGRPVTVGDAPEHFDVIAGEYNAQWSPHVWDLLLDRKLSLMQRALEARGLSQGIGLDLGCGLGVQTAEMRRRGCQVIGVEPSVGLLQHRPSTTLPVVAGDALALPLPDHSVDYVYVIGVLHHLPGRVGQARAFAEIARVLKPNGLLLIHESNPHNPLFRFYMGYLFPLLKRIDEGTEWWLHPDTWVSETPFAPVSVDFFTFLPDFTPRALMPLALSLERRLERGATRRYSAHYLAVVTPRNSVSSPSRAAV